MLKFWNRQTYLPLIVYATSSFSYVLKSKLTNWPLDSKVPIREGSSPLALIITYTLIDGQKIAILGNGAVLRFFREHLRNLHLRNSHPEYCNHRTNSPSSERGQLSNKLLTYRWLQNSSLFPFDCQTLNSAVRKCCKDTIEDYRHFCHTPIRFRQPTPSINLNQVGTLKITSNSRSGNSRSHCF